MSNAVDISREQYEALHDRRDINGLAVAEHDAYVADGIGQSTAAASTMPRLSTIGMVRSWPANT